MLNACKTEWQRAVSAVIKRTAKQDETLGHFLHTLSAASLIGAITLGFSTSSDSSYAGLRALCLFAAGVMLFVMGMVLNEGKRRVKGNQGE